MKLSFVDRIKTGCCPISHSLCTDHSCCKIVRMHFLSMQFFPQKKIILLSRTTFHIMYNTCIVV